MRVANIVEEGKLAGPQVRIILAAHAMQGKVETTVIMPEENSADFRIKCDEFVVPYKTFSLSRITKELSVALRYLLFSPFEVLKLTRYFKKEHFDIVHVSGGSWQYKGVIAGWLAGKKVLWHLNDTSMPWLFRKLFSLFSRLADGYIYASQRSKEYYGSLGQKGKPEFIIPAPVDVSRFDPSKELEGDEDEIKRWQGKIVIGTVANINPIKGLELFIQTAARLNKLNSAELAFIVIGPIFPRQQSYFLRIQKLCDELGMHNIEFVGPRSDIRPLLKRFDIYVCSSLAESSPISVWEAMAMKKPVVSTDVGDVPLYVRDGQNGFIVEVGDVAAMTEKVSALVQNEEMRTTFGHRSRGIAVKKLDVAKCAERHFETYRKMYST